MTGTDSSEGTPATERAVSPVGSGADAKLTGEKDVEATAVPVVVLPTWKKQRWNNPRINILRIGCCCLGSWLTGLNEASYGPLVPYLSEYYNLSYATVSYVFLVPAFGYLIAAIANDSLTRRFGRRVVSVIVPGCRIVTYAVLSQHPPYPVVVVIVAVMGFAIANMDACYNSFLGGVLEDSAIPLSLMHASYGLGSLIAPIIVTGLVERSNRPWWTYHYILLGLAVFEMALAVPIFRGEDANAMAAQQASESASDSAPAPLPSSSPLPPQPEKRQRTDILYIMFYRPWALITWFYSAFLFFNVAVEFGLGGWTTSFVRDLRGAEPFAAGLASTGYWTGLTVGRLVLGFVMSRIGEVRMLTATLPLLLVLQLVFWFVPSFNVAAAMVALQGFFIGPAFPAYVIFTSRQLPRSHHISVLSFSCIIGRIGASLIPYVVGPAAAARGIWVVQPFMVAMEVACFVTWVLMPKHVIGGAKEEPVKRTWREKVLRQLWWKYE